PVSCARSGRAVDPRGALPDERALWDLQPGRSPPATLRGRARGRGGGVPRRPCRRAHGPLTANHRSGSGCVLEIDLIAQVEETLDEPAGDLALVALVEVICAQVLVLHAVLEQVPGRGEHRGCDRNDGLLATALALEPIELRPQVAVLRSDRGPRRLHERRLQPGRPLTDARVVPLARALVAART